LKKIKLFTGRTAGIVGCIFLIFLVSLNHVSGQVTKEKKMILATRIERAPQMDGKMSDPVWELGARADNFFQFEPHNDREATLATEVRILYDDFSIYIGAKMHDPESSKILTEQGLRDADSKLNSDQV